MSAVDFDTRTIADQMLPYFHKIYDLKDPVEGRPIATEFHKLPPRALTEYYKVIREPKLLNLIKVCLNNARYLEPQQFVSDLCRITWNARYFNEEELSIYQDAVELDNYVRNTVIPGINSNPLLTRGGQYHVIYPDLGPIVPQAFPGTPAGNSDDDDLDYGDSHMLGTSTPGGLFSHHLAGLQLGLTPRGRRAARDDAWTKRGRPPVIDRPHEQRIKNVVRGLKKLRLPITDHELYQEFDRLPSREEAVDYLQVVTNPMCFDMIRIKIKQRKYRDFEWFAQDVALLVANAKLYFPPHAAMHKDAEVLEQKFNELALEELRKPDSTYIDPTQGMRTPLDLVEVNGERYAIGDWVLLNNPNEGQKPTVGQVFRLWVTKEGERWLNVCWYYRAEQTVHRFDRLFYENEVFKTGQYRDHPVEEIIGHCYVAFLTRYQRGDPVGTRGPVFVCEFRYNDSNREFNKIRTWKACLPDEVRLVEDPIDPLPEGLRKMIKYELPLKHLLPPDATIDMPIPEPVMGHPNAPPVVGGIYLRGPYDLDDSLGEYSTSAKLRDRLLHSPAPANQPGAFMLLLGGPNPLVLPSQPYGRQESSVPPPPPPPVAMAMGGPGQMPPTGYPGFSGHVSMFRPLMTASPVGGMGGQSVHHAASTTYTAQLGTSLYVLPKHLLDTVLPYIGAVVLGMDATNTYRRAVEAGAATPWSVMGDRPVLWFRGPPVKVHNRLQVHTNTQLDERFVNRVNGEGSEAKRNLRKREQKPVEHDENVELPLRGRAGYVLIGPSMAYLAWKRRRSAQ